MDDPKPTPMSDLDLYFDSQAADRPDARSRARAEIQARGLDPVALERLAAQAAERVRGLTDRSLLALYLMDRDAAASGLWRVAGREVERREAERGRALTWHTTQEDL
jgi:hypothetical protein